jgi:hypothetical protein
MVLIWESLSMTPVFLIYIPFLPKMRMAFPKVNGTVKSPVLSVTAPHKQPSPSAMCPVEYNLPRSSQPVEFPAVPGILTLIFTHLFSFGVKFNIN